jgi:hypothetical protein
MLPIEAVMTKAKKRRPPVSHHRRRAHDARWKGSLAMTIENIEENDLTASEREVLAADRERFQRLASGSHLDEFSPSVRA